MSISAVLASFKDAPKLVLNQKNIDDKGAKQLAKFIQSSGKIQLLQLKSNDITGQGFAQIFRALTKNPNIRQIILEYNRLGEDEDGSWPSYFSSMIDRCSRLQRLNISNNKLNRRGFAQIKTSLSNSKSLKLVQLKYNQIPTTEISQFIDELKNAGNQTLLYVDLTGNKVEKDVINTLQSFLKANREKNPVSKDSLMATGGFYNRNAIDNTLSLTQKSFNKVNAIDDLSKQNVLKHLEDLLDQNRKGTTEMKSKLQAELADLKRKQLLDDKQINQLDKTCNEFLIENRNLKYQFDKTLLEHQQIQRDQQFEAKVREERMAEANRQLNQMQLKYEEIENRMNRDHDMKLKQIARNWQARLRQVQQRIRDVQAETNNVDNQIRKFVEKRQKLRVQYEQQQQNLRVRVQDQQSQRYNFKLKVLETRIKQVEDSRQKFYTRGQNILYEFETNQRENSLQINNIEEQISTMKIKQEQLVAENKDYVARNQNIKHQINLKQITIQKLQEEINRINSEIQLRKSHNRQQLQKILADNELGRQRRAADKQTDIQKLHELETTLRNYQVENAKLEQQYMILEQRLQASLGKAVQQVFTQSNLY